MLRRSTKLQRVTATCCIVFAGLLLLLWIRNATMLVGATLYHSETRDLSFSPEGIDFSRLKFVPDQRPAATLRNPPSMTAHGELYDDEHQLGAHYQGYRIFLIPYWLPIGLLLIFPGTLIARGIYRNKLEAFRKRSGLCVACGYNIAVTPNRCPECGMVPSGH